MVVAATATTTGYALNVGPATSETNYMGPSGFADPPTCCSPGRAAIFGHRHTIDGVPKDIGLGRSPKERRRRRQPAW